MDDGMYQKYSSIELPAQMFEFYSDKIRSDEILLQVFNYICEQAVEIRDDELAIAVTVKSIVDNVQVKRKVMQPKTGRAKKEKSFVEAVTNIDRNKVDRCLEILMAMGLVFYRNFGMLKSFYLTNNGKKLFVYMYQQDNGTLPTLEGADNI
ncbi:hypothetical protein P9597_10770 [Aneurinibacillus migulanus]|uniref:hypothetical protein n=1 Tax=Aneurinibacillus migulanus TaxID=47500 RepID=UPI002E1CD964|nr:hypothetical protein [Aneurinibacillus migulanus]